MTTVACPTCRKAVVWKESNTHRPFCSERCQLIDLGAWANEEYRVPAENAHPDDLDQSADQDGMDEGYLRH